MAGRSPEARQFTQTQTAPQVQESQPVPQDQDTGKKSKTERGAKFYRNLSLAQGAVWTGIGVVASGGLAAVAFGAAAFNGVEAGVSHKIAKNQEKKRVEDAADTKKERVPKTDMKPRKEYAAMTTKELRQGGM